MPQNTEQKPAEKKSNDKTVHQAQKSTVASTQLYLKIAEIRDDTIVLKNGGIRSILEVSSVNFNLKSEEEQNAIIYSYQGFLNSIEFPIQILIRSKKLDIDNYIEQLNQLGFFQNLTPKDTFTELQRRHKEFVGLKKNLNQRTSVVKSGLESCGLKVDQLRTQDLIEMFYEIYNPLSARNQKVDELEKIDIKTDKDVLSEEERNNIGTEEE
jgi:hypothetical protein